MPIGCSSCVPAVARLVHERRPARVLDLGIGMGFYGAAVRQWADMGVRPWSTRLIGVEAWPAYRNPCWDLYDAVNVCPIDEFLGRARGLYDLILLMDVLEHFTFEAGSAVLDRAAARLAPGGEFVVATPGVFVEQGAAHGNPYEVHRSLWTADALKERGFEVLTDGAEWDAYGNRMVLGVQRVQG